jgi:hypothetical protein
VVEGLPTPDEKDLELLRSVSRRNYSRLLARSVFAIIGALLGVLLTVHFVRRNEPVEFRLADARRTIDSSGVQWSEDVSGQIASYQEWLYLHGTALEASLFADSASLLAHSMVATAGDDTDESEMGLFRQVYLSLHMGLMRVLFLVIASLRALIVVMAAAIVLGLRSFRPYSGDDVLGQMGNGRMFYSGVRAGLDKLTAQGAPDVQVRGLACPQLATQVETRASSIWRVLGEYGAQNSTNEGLVAVLTKNRLVSAYVAAPEDDGALNKACAGTTLGEHVPDLLEAALSLHARFAAGEFSEASPAGPEATTGKPFTSGEYASAVRSALDRVVSPELKRELGALSAAEVATTILSLQCGKVLAHSLEGGRWILRSQFPQLNARAVLHSVLEYPEECDFYQRTRIRQALIYASRSSSFAPVRMPIGMPNDIWALRQWVEVLLANPHELPAAADDVELVGVVRAAHQAWNDEFLESLDSAAPGDAGYVATAAGLLFVPLKDVLAILRRAVPSNSIKRLEELLTAVSTKQRLRAAELAKRDGEVPDQLSFDRIFPPLTDSEVETLTKLHGYSERDIRDWSAMRIVLTSYAWLARRVGDYTVPESSLIFAAFKAREPLPGANDLGLLGKSGLVPFRGARLESRRGASWHSRFLFADKATMSETQEDFEKLMQGLEEKLEDEASSSLSPVSA